MCDDTAMTARLKDVTLFHEDGHTDRIEGVARVQTGGGEWKLTMPNGDLHLGPYRLRRMLIEYRAES